VLVSPGVVCREDIPEDGRGGDDRDDEREREAHDVHHRVELQRGEDSLDKVRAKGGTKICLRTRLSQPGAGKQMKWLTIPSRSSKPEMPPCRLEARRRIVQRVRIIKSYTIAERSLGLKRRRRT
jgi:hypothetical protein